jgi:hypothetical protein
MCERDVDVAEMKMWTNLRCPMKIESMKIELIKISGLIRIIK